jgi:SAM-dependent methyltransferase
MRRFWQDEWFGIKFSSFTTLNPNRLADEEFYNQFYEVFFLKFNDYDDLPSEWRKDKKVLSDFIIEQVKSKDRILSIGCGSGFVENELSKQFSGEIVAVEPSLNASKWLRENATIKLINGYFPNCLKDNDRFNFAYMSYIDYIFDDSMYIGILRNIREYPIEDFLLIGASVYTPDFIQSIKQIIKNIFISLGIHKEQQLWGYQRTMNEHLNLFKSAGYKNVQFGQLENGTYWIRAKNE